MTKYQIEHGLYVLPIPFVVAFESHVISVDGVVVPCDKEEVIVAVARYNLAKQKYRKIRVGSLYSLLYVAKS